MNVALNFAPRYALPVTSATCVSGTPSVASRAKENEGHAAALDPLAQSGWSSKNRPAASVCSLFRIVQDHCVVTALSATPRMRRQPYPQRGC